MGAFGITIRPMTRHALSLMAVVLLASAAAVATQTQKTHRLEATPDTVAYGYYWSVAKPVLRIASGDILDVDTLLTSTPQTLAGLGVADDRIQASLKAVTAAFPRGAANRGPGGHVLTGPVYVEGAEPGDALEVKILSIDLPIDYGYNGCSGPLPANCDPRSRTTLLTLDRKTLTTQFLPGIVIPLKPFFGSMGVSPAPDLGRVSSNPPGRHGGNIDNRELVAGSTLTIPVFVPGALFEVGDGHAAQGDGEVDQTAIETSLRGRLQLTVRKGLTLAWPRAETADRLHHDGHGSGLDGRDEGRHPGDDRLPRGDQRPDETAGVPTDEHGGARDGDADRGRAEHGRPRQAGEEPVHEMTGAA